MRRVSAQRPHAQSARQASGVALGGEHVALHFAQRDRALGQLAVGVEDRVLRVLPALVAEAALAPGGVLDETVAVAVAVVVDPAQRRLQVRPDRADGLEVAGALVVHARQHHEQRRRVDAAVVQPERHLAEARHFALAGLVQDLAGLGVRFGPLLRRLGGGQELQDSPGDRGIDPQQLHRRDDAVAAERGAEPGDAGVGVSPVRGVSDQHVEIRDRATQDLVQDLVRGRDRGGAGGGGAQRAPRLAQGDEEPLVPGSTGGAPSHATVRNSDLRS